MNALLFAEPTGGGAPSWPRPSTSGGEITVIEGALKLTGRRVYKTGIVALEYSTGSRLERIQDMSVVERMTRAAKSLLTALDARAVAAPFDSPDYREWTYLPGPRPGLSMVDMTDRQQELALELLDTGCSVDGARTARAVIELDRIRRELTSSGKNLDGDRYWVRIFGDPGDDTPWGWRVNGHHLAVHITVVGRRVAATPSFFGAEPAVVPAGPHAGRRTLSAEEELARTLLADLDPDQRSVAIVSSTAPRDILTRDDPVADPAVLPGGLSYADMNAAQRAALVRLVRTYVDRAPVEVADASWQAAVTTGLDALSFAWAGSDERGEGHYYCIHGPTLLIEYDNTQDNANHIHSVWRDLQRDWGQDLLAAHYARNHA